MRTFGPEVDAFEQAAGAGTIRSLSRVGEHRHLESDKAIVWGPEHSSV